MNHPFSCSKLLPTGYQYLSIGTSGGDLSQVAPMLSWTFRRWEWCVAEDSTPISHRYTFHLLFIFYSDIYSDSFGIESHCRSCDSSYLHVVNTCCRHLFLPQSHHCESHLKRRFTVLQLRLVSDIVLRLVINAFTSRVSALSAKHR